MSATALSPEARWKRLIELCLHGNGSVGLDDLGVAPLYRPVKSRQKQPSENLLSNARRAKFVYDCERLIQVVNEARETYLAPFALPLPEFDFDRKTMRLRIVRGQRAFLRDFNRTDDRIIRREKICHAMLEKSWPKDHGQPIVPTGEERVFIGFGTTMTILVRTLMEDELDRYRHLTVYTTNVEALLWLYCQRRDPIDPLPGLRLGTDLLVQFREGAMRPLSEGDRPRVSTVFLGCAAVIDGTIYSDANETMHDVSQKILKDADRVIYICEGSKIGVPGQIAIPPVEPKESRRMLLVSDRPEGEVKKHLPPGMAYLYCVPH